MNFIKRIVIGIPLISILFLSIIFYPSLYLRHRFEYRNLCVYSDKPLPENACIVLAEVHELIKGSDFYVPNLKIKIFIRDNFKNYSWIPWQFPTSGYGQAIPIIENIFIGNADFQSNQAYHPNSKKSRTLSKVLAHEIIHILIFHHSYKSWCLHLFNKLNWSSVGLLWKEEGYAEYIAKEWIPDRTNNMLSGASDLSAFGKEYYSYWIAVKHLLEDKEMTIDQILNSNIDLEELLSELRICRPEHLQSRKPFND